MIGTNQVYSCILRLRSDKRAAITFGSILVLVFLAAILVLFKNPSCQQGNFVVGKKWGSSALDGRFQVDLVIRNLPEECFGRLDVRGEGIVGADGREYNWIEFPFPTKISGHGATIRFWQKASRTNFKVFQTGGWEEVLVDPYGSSGNIRLDLSRVSKVGGKVRVSVDCAVNKVPMPPPYSRSGFIFKKAIGTSSLNSDSIQVELAINNLNSSWNGTRLTVRGADIINQEGLRENWAGDDVSAEVKNGSATLVFWQERPVTDFKVFQCETVKEALADKRSRDGNMRFNLRAIAKPGETVRIYADAGL